MRNESPVNTANELMCSIASAMDALILFWKKGGKTCGNAAKLRNAVDFIDSQYVVLRELIPAVREYVADAWNDIVVNDMLRMSVRRLSLTCKDFMRKCVEFEGAWNRNEASAFSLFDDMWRARKYVALCHDSQNRDGDIYQAAAKGCIPLSGKGGGSSQRARAFEDYFLGVSDDELDYFIRFAQPMNVRVKWLGKRDEAVIFAEAFGLSAKDMNRSFIIPSRSGAHRDLSLSSDAPSFNCNQYPIWKAIRKYQSLTRE